MIYLIKNFLLLKYFLFKKYLIGKWDKLTLDKPSFEPCLAIISRIRLKYFVKINLLYSLWQIADER